MDDNIQPLLVQGWKFSEFLQWITLSDKSEFISMLGEQNVFVVDEAYAKNKWKGRFLISPTGLEILNLYMMPAAGTA